MTRQGCLGAVLVVLVAAQHVATAGEAAAQEMPEWSKPVDGLACRLYVAPHDPATTEAISALTLEIRNVSDGPIAIPAYHGTAPILSVRIQDYPELASPPTWSDLFVQPFVLAPGQSWVYRVSQNYSIAYGRYDMGWITFDPAGRTYRLSVTAQGRSGIAVPEAQERPGAAKVPKLWASIVSSNAVELPLPHRPRPAAHWPGSATPATVFTPWSEPTAEGLQTRIAGHAQQFVLGQPVYLRVELRHQSGKNWARNTTIGTYQGPVLVADATGKRLGERTVWLRFNTMLREGEVRVLALFDLADKEYGLTEPGRFSVRFGGFEAGELAKKGLVDLPPSPPLEVELLAPDKPLAALALDRQDKAAEDGDRPRADIWRGFPGLKRRHAEGMKRLEDWLTSLEPVAFAAEHGALAKQARSADRAERLRAWKAIAALRDPAALPLLIEAARAEDPREQAEAMAALATWVYDAYHPARRVPKDLAPMLPFFLETLLGLGDRPNVRSSCFQGIGCLAGVEWLPLVKDMAASRHPAVTHWSGWAMKEIAARAPAKPVADAKADALPRWVDSKAGEVWFAVGDIVRFDWEKQLFELRRRRAMDVMVNEMRLVRKFTLRDGQGVIYRGAFTSPMSSMGFAEPAILVSPLGDGPQPPLFRIDAGYPGKIGDRDDRFAPRLKAALERAGVLGTIDPKAPPPPIERIRSEWSEEAGGLRARVELFPETFRLGEPARLHLVVFGRQPDGAEADTLGVAVTLTANGGRYGNAAHWALPLASILADRTHAIEYRPWGPARGHLDSQAKAGPAELQVRLSTRKRLGRDGGALRYSAALDTIELPPVQLTILPAAAPPPRAGAPGGAAEPDRDAIASELRRIVAIREQEVARVERLFKAGAASGAEVAQARVALAEARVRLLERQEAGKAGPAAAGRDATKDPIVQELRRIVALAQEQTARTRKLFETGRAPQADVAKAELALAEARLRLAQRLEALGAEAPETP